MKISGGGRCNVTHHCFDPKTLSKNTQEALKNSVLLFTLGNHRTLSIGLREKRVQLKAEADGRMFPTTDDSQTIINCFLEEARKSKIKLKKGHSIDGLRLNSNGSFLLKINGENEVSYTAVCLALGSLKSTPLEHSLRKLGHSIES